MKNTQPNPNTETFPVSDRQMRKARSFARSMTNEKSAQKAITEQLKKALAIFGGRISGFETKAIQMRGAQ